MLNKWRPDRLFQYNDLIQFSCFNDTKNYDATSERLTPLITVLPQWCIGFSSKEKEITPPSIRSVQVKSSNYYLQRFIYMRSHDEKECFVPNILIIGDLLQATYTCTD